ncbi:MAG: hypothetical protein QNJ78_03865 [Gammaproteobacteria bacterium]|nr:hypothetical protein [Gammaproteobacteria bacterium]
MKIAIVYTTLLTALLIGSSAHATGVTINGQSLSYSQKAALERQIGQTIAPGNYISDGDCWVETRTGARGCLSRRNVDTTVFSRYGSGSYDSRGNWSHWSDLPEGGFGGTSDGCIYTSYGWSNC